MSQSEHVRCSAALLQRIGLSRSLGSRATWAATARTPSAMTVKKIKCRFMRLTIPDSLNPARSDPRIERAL